MVIKIDFENASFNNKWLDLFGPNALDIVCKSENELKQQGGQTDIGKINWGGAVFEHAWASVAHDRNSQFYLARLAIDIKTVKPMTADFCSVVGCSSIDDNFHTSILDLREKLLKRVVDADLVFYTPKGATLTGNSECTAQYLESKEYIAVNPKKSL